MNHCSFTLLTGCVLEELAALPADSVQCVVTSPPYWGLRDYGIEPSAWGDGWIGCLGLEPTPAMFVGHVVEIFASVWRVLRPDGTLWINLGDCYATGAGAGGEHPGGGAQGERWKRGPATNGRGEAQNNRRGGHKHGYAGAIGPLTQPNRMPQPGLKPKDLVGIPWRVAFALQEFGWWLRRDIIWSKPNPMPESVTDRPTTAHEYLFLMTKSEKYFYDADAIREPSTGNAYSRGEGLNPKARVPTGWDTGDGDHRQLTGRYAQPNSPQSIKSPHGQGFTRRAGKNSRVNVDRVPRARKSRQNESFSAAVTEPVLSRNKRSVWTIATQPFPEAHFATFPEEIPRTCILAGTKPGDVVLDPFSGAGTTGVAALALGRDYIGIDRKPEYIAMARRRLEKVAPLFATERVAT
jgi:site-specific DNA-methyltransferase (cytosine-N4-specific)